MEITVTRTEIETAVKDFVLKRLSGLAVDAITFQVETEFGTANEKFSLLGAKITVKEPTKSFTGPTPRTAGMTNASQY